LKNQGYDAVSEKYCHFSTVYNNNAKNNLMLCFFNFENPEIVWHKKNYGVELIESDNCWIMKY
jgi:hypothetical protein